MEGKKSPATGSHWFLQMSVKGCWWRWSLSILPVHHMCSGAGYLQFFPLIPPFSGMFCPIFLETELDSQVCSLYLASRPSAGSSFHGIFMNFMLLRQHFLQQKNKESQKLLYVSVPLAIFSPFCPLLNSELHIFSPTQSMSWEGKPEKQFPLPTHKPLSILRSEFSKGVDVILTSGFNPDSKFQA